jgi:hypothetical protein
MSSIFRFLFFVFIITVNTRLYAQINCDSFCVKEILIDTSANPNILRYVINFRGTNTQFINYPFISALTNSNNDTLGTGGLFFFGQFGGTEEIYEVSTSLDSIPTDFLIHFAFDTSVCIFNNFCNPVISFTDLSANENYQIFYNPTQKLISSNTTILFEKAFINIYDLNGRIISTNYIFNTFDSFPLQIDNPGLYFFEICWNNKRLVKPFIVRND